MKKTLFILLFAAGGLTALESCTGTAYVASGPPVYPVETVVVGPSPRHVWVPGRYVYRNNNYVWVGGYHAVPPRGRTTWVEGRWDHGGRGYHYSRGYWR